MLPTRALLRGVTCHGGRDAFATFTGRGGP